MVPGSPEEDSLSVLQFLGAYLLLSQYWIPSVVMIMLRQSD
jgi:hypothetical protein